MVEQQQHEQQQQQQPPATYRIGLIADVQYADIDDARSAYGSTRHYRDAPNKVRMAVEDWKASGCTFAVNLGDTIDRRSEKGASAALAQVLAVFEGFSPVVHVCGNHDLSSLSAARVELLSPRRSLGGLDAEVGPGEYCDIRIGEGWRALVLDTYAVAVKRDAAAARRSQAKFLAEARASKDPVQHLTMHEELNGAIGEVQMLWMRGRLEDARAAGERVVVLGHSPLNMTVTYYGDAVCWDWKEATSLVDEFPDVVAAVITGHDHHYGTLVTEAGVYHRVLEAAMEGEVGQATHAVLEMQGDAIRLLGRGDVQSWSKSFPPRASA